MSEDLVADSVRVICGPTASGKSTIALRLAERFGAAVVSADSRQIYLGFDIGTAKPTKEERRRVAHFCIDTVDPRERYSAAAWADCARRAIAEIVASGRIPLVVGGTGFYLRALFEPLFREPELDPARRVGLAEYLGALPVGELRRWCRELDPERAHLGRSQLLRAIEIALLTGARLSDLHGSDRRSTALRPRYLVVDPGSSLAHRIEERLDAMFLSGWEDEVRCLAARVPRDAPAWNATGYQAVRDLVDTRMARADARRAVLVATRQYAKRQRTWFRNQLAGSNVTRLEPGNTNEDAALMQWWLREEEH